MRPERYVTGEEQSRATYIAGLGGWRAYLAYTAGVTPEEDREFEAAKEPREEQADG